jgi:hypothetical protein
VSLDKIFQKLQTIHVCFILVLYSIRGKKKRLAIFPSPAGMSLTRLGTGKSLTFFYSVPNHHILWCFDLASRWNGFIYIVFHDSLPCGLLRFLCMYMPMCLQDMYGHMGGPCRHRECSAATALDDASSSSTEAEQQISNANALAMAGGWLTQLPGCNLTPFLHLNHLWREEWTVLQSLWQHNLKKKKKNSSDVFVCVFLFGRLLYKLLSLWWMFFLCRYKDHFRYL